MGRETQTLHVSFVWCLPNIGFFLKPLNLLLQYPLYARLSHTYFCVHSLFTVRCLLHSKMYFSSGTGHPFMYYFHVFSGVLAPREKNCRWGHNILLHIKMRKTLKHRITVGLYVIKFLQDTSYLTPVGHLHHTTACSLCSSRMGKS